MTKSVRNRVICPVCATYVDLHKTPYAKRCLLDVISYGRDIKNRTACQLIENRMRELEEIIKEIRGFIK